MREVILHYHLFKNAGTSIDAILQRNFPNKWVTREFPSDSVQSDLADWIKRTDAICFSSHTATLPPPVISDVNILPIIFIRHPIDRIVSAYTFERQQVSNSFGAVLARHTSLAGYIETRLSLPHDRQCRNFHTHRLAQMFQEGDEFSRAKTALFTLPFIGLVEKFSLSLGHLKTLLSDRGFADLIMTPLERNVSRVKKPLDEKLTDIRIALGEDVYTKLLKANYEDLELYELCKQIYELGSLQEAPFMD